MNHFARVLSVVVLAGMLCLANAEEPRNPKPCSASGITNESTFSWGTDEPRFAFLKKIQKLLEKIPLVKTVEFEASVGGAIKIGEECCEGAKKPSPYTEYTGSGEASFTIDIIGLGAKITLSPHIPIPFTGIELAGELHAEASISGGGTLAATVDVTGRDGDCGCLSISGTGSVSPAVTATLGGNGFLGYFSSTGPHGFTAELSGEASVNVAVTVTGGANFGKSCEDDPALKVCFQWPVFTFNITVDVPIPFVPTVDYTFEWDIVASLGFESENCFP